MLATSMRPWTESMASADGSTPTGIVLIRHPRVDYQHASRRIHLSAHGRDHIVRSRINCERRDHAGQADHPH